MQSVFERDKKKRQVLAKIELLRKVLKYILFNKFLGLSIRWSAFSRLDKVSWLGNYTKLVKRCVKTYRGRSTLRRFRLSRIFFRSFARFGRIVGLVKKSW
jgi:succinate dehydrogenase (ubiquinone) iron-sulfur subunit